MRPHKMLLFNTVAVLMIASLFEGFGISMLIPILQSISEAQTTNTFVQFTQRCFEFLNIQYGFIPLIILFAFVTLFQYFLVGLQQYLSRLLHATMTYEMRKNIFKNLMDVSLNYYYETKSGDLVSTTWLSTNNAGGLVEYFFLMLKGATFAGVYIVINCFISLPLTALTLLLSSPSAEGQRRADNFGVWHVYPGYEDLCMRIWMPGVQTCFVSLRGPLSLLRCSHVGNSRCQRLTRP